MSEVKTKNAKLKTNITIERTDTISWGALVILVMRQTGVGKSSFIEALARGKSMGISKDQLEGFTQDITLYRVFKVRSFLGPQTYIVNTPGFSDRKISEVKIIKMIQAWMKLHKRDIINRILYIDRITDIRMSGSKGKRLEMFKSMTGAESATYITLVTTMWDNLWQDSEISHAEERFQQLKDIHWKEFVDEGAHITKFRNTRESALQILDECIRPEGSPTTNPASFAFEKQLGIKSLGDTTYGPMVYQTLIERISGLEQKLRLLDDDLENEETKKNEEFFSVLRKEKSEAMTDLMMFQTELKDFDLSEPQPSTYDHLRQSLERSKERIKIIFSRKKKEL